jgi:hypothetical protein
MAEMPRESLLLGLAEVSVALTGFAGIVVFLGRRAAGQWTPSDRTRFTLMIAFGLQALLFSLAPLLVWELTLEPTATWAASSAVGAVVGAFGLIAGGGRLIRTARAHDEEANLALGGVLMGGTALILLALVLNALGFGLSRTFAPYLVALLWNLAWACLFFLRLLRFS